MKMMNDKWKIAPFIAAVILFAAGCGSKIPKDSLTRPPEITLTSMIKEAGEITLNAGSYSWNYRISKEEGTGSIADAPAPLAENYPWEILVLPASASGEEQYKFSFAWIVKELEDKTDEINWPDELLVNAYSETDIGAAEAEAVETAAYTREDIEAEDFVLNFRPGMVYEIVLSWSRDDYDKDGFYGTASYVFRTMTSEPEE